MNSSIKYVQNKANKLSSNDQKREFLYCAMNPFYFIYNYVYLPEIGGILKYDESKMHSKMKRVIRSVMNYHKCILMASRQLGKALDIDTPIPMADGSFKRMCDVVVGDRVLDDEHNPTRVMNVTPIMNNRPCYRLTFSNGESIIADENHLWKVITTNNLNNICVITTKKIFNKPNKYSIYIPYKDGCIELISIKKVKPRSTKCIEVFNEDGMFLCGKHKIPTHNSTIAACLLEWAVNFYPRVPATILNANKSFALENLQKVKFIHENLPSFLKIPLRYKGDRKTFLEYTNGSVVRIYYPSSSTSPEVLARSLTCPILYVDEAAFITHMREAWGSAQPTLSSARDQAIKHGFPYFLLVTSTPNGTVGKGQWFFEMHKLAVDCDNIFNDTDHLIPSANEIVDAPERNGFVRIDFHWSEDPRKDDKWYQEQRRDLNFDQRLINQELDLLFVGSTTCIFSDEFLGQLSSTPPVEVHNLKYATRLNLFTETMFFDPTDFLLIGVDSAKSLTGDYNAIEIYSYAEFIQVGEFFAKLGSITKYSEILMQIIKLLAEPMQNRIILCVENNSIGAAVIEDLENAEDGFDYAQYIYSPEPEKSVGINTHRGNRSLMVSFLYDYIIDAPNNIVSSDLINQLNVIERKVSGKIEAQTGQNDDLFMASALCAYTRRLSALDYEPQLGITSITHGQQQSNKIQNIIQSSSFTNKSELAMQNNQIQMAYNLIEGGIEYIDSSDDKVDSLHRHDGEDLSDVFSLL